jgi:uncharacterized C2H2 Zn-finger protein
LSGHSKAEKKAWLWFSRYIRERDNEGGIFRCPTCGAVKPIEEADAGHYISRVRKSVMFDEMNVHAQCRKCNRFMGGQHFLYRRWLVERHGEKAVELLEQRAQMSGGHKTGDLLLLADLYRQKTQDLIREREDALPVKNKV